MTALQLLNLGCEIKFPSGYILRGDPQNGYIDTLIETDDELYTDGLRSLSETGVEEAIHDANNYANISGFDPM